MEKQELEVKIISSEFIKPSSPTPPHLKTFNLSSLDQVSCAQTVTFLLFYANPKPFSTKGVYSDTHIDINVLKQSLSQTLSQFYPLAGRCKDQSTVLCNDEGVPFIETDVNCHLSDILSSRNKVELLHNFVPPQDMKALGPRPMPDLVHLAFQINVFACGGVVIGCHMLHKLLDTASIGTFLKYWSALASKRYDKLVQPDFDTILKAFPPSPEFEGVSTPELLKDSPTVNMVLKSFILTKDAICNLKAKATSEQVLNPTKFEAVAGFVWEHALAALYTTANTPLNIHDEGVTMLAIIASMRGKGVRPLPKESIGNLFTFDVAKAQRGVGLRELVAEIHGTLSRVKNKIERDEVVPIIHGEPEYKMGFYGVTSWSKLGLEEVDFGCGKPMWITPTDGKLPHAYRNYIWFTDHVDSSGDGIEAWLFLEENEMRILWNNTQFLAFATPNC